MSEDHCLQHPPKEYFAERDHAGVLSAPDMPEDNRILAALPERELERLRPALEPVALPHGWTIHGSGDRERCLYFLTSGIVARLYVTQAGSTAGLALTGREGVIGVASFLGGESTPSQAVVLAEGHAYRLGAAALAEEIERGGMLPILLLRYTQALLAQIGQTAACNRHHSLEQQLCRWMLAYMDRLSSNELKITQTLIAEMLGVRRESITHVAGILERAGLIRRSRGSIVVLDRAGLQRRACECYWVVKLEFARLLPKRRQAALLS